MVDKEPLPESDEARGRTVEELRRDNAGLRERLERVEKKLEVFEAIDDVDDDEDDDEGDDGEDLEPWE
jgi:hypothetical protein